MNWSVNWTAQPTGGMGAVVDWQPIVVILAVFLAAVVVVFCALGLAAAIREYRRLGRRIAAATPPERLNSGAS